MGKLAGKVAIITGGNSGIGLASSVAFAAEGAQVVITGRRKNVVDDAVAQIGHGAVGVVGDAGKLADIDALVEEVVNRFGRVDIVFANAGINELADIGDVDESQFDKHFDTNVKGVYFLVKKALPHLREGSSVILAGSVATEKILEGHNVYAATKAALNSLVKSWTYDMRGRGIRFNVLSPGPVKTPILAKMGLSAEQFAELDRAVAAKIPLGRWGQPEELAKAALFLASDDSSFVTGIDLQVDGGMAQV